MSLSYNYGYKMKPKIIFIPIPGTDMYHVKLKEKLVLLGLKKEHLILGGIKWHSKVTKYAFYAEPYTIFDSNCLKEIAKFIEGLIEKRKK